MSVIVSQCVSDHDLVDNVFVRVSHINIPKDSLCCSVLEKEERVEHCTLHNDIEVVYGLVYYWNTLITSGCFICGKEAGYQCVKCKIVRYCSKECQLDHWKTTHKTHCMHVSNILNARGIPALKQLLVKLYNQYPKERRLKGDLDQMDMQVINTTLDLDEITGLSKEVKMGHEFKEIVNPKTQKEEIINVMGKLSKFSCSRPIICIIHSTKSHTGVICPIISCDCCDHRHCYGLRL